MVLEIWTPADEDSLSLLLLYKNQSPDGEIDFAVSIFQYFWKCRKPKAIPSARLCWWQWWNWF